MIEIILNYIGVRSELKYLSYWPINFNSRMEWYFAKNNTKTDIKHHRFD